MTLERDFQAKVLELAEWNGWIHHHEYDSRRGTAGFPDLVLVRGDRVLWVELKSDRGRVRPEQKLWIAALRAAGQDVRVWRPSDWDEVESNLSRRRAVRDQASTART